jgi:hypothetical protein
VRWWEVPSPSATGWLTSDGGYGNTDESSPGKQQKGSKLSDLPECKAAGEQVEVVGGRRRACQIRRGVEARSRPAVVWRTSTQVREEYSKPWSGVVGRRERRGASAIW